MSYLQLAEDQFNILKEEILDDDRHAVGASNKKDYKIDGRKLTIEVDGFWEKATWFDWAVKDAEGYTVVAGTRYF